MNGWDVIVVGSGAGALTSALRAQDQGLSVLVIEKSDKYGGTSALSGGGIWIPMNPQITGLGGEDNFNDAWTYVTTATRGTVPEARLRTYLETGPKMLRWLAERTQLTFHALPKYPDYYPDLPGSRPGYRTMEPSFFDASKLGDSFAELRPAAIGTLLLGRVSMGQAEAGILFARAPGWMALTAKLLTRYWTDIGARLRGRRDRRLALGQALVGALRASLADRDIPLWLNTSFKDLVVEDGRVTGIDVDRGGKTERLVARKAVILAAGGFERNQEMRERYLPTPTQTTWTAAAPGNTGDTIRAGIAIGAATAFMDRAWWSPTVPMPGQDTSWAVMVERCAPGCVIVNAKGKRFANEAMPYLEFGDAMYADHAAGNGTVPAWMVFDARYRWKYAAGPLLPAQISPDRGLPREWEGDIYHKAESLDALAAKINVDAAGLRDTVERMNGYAATGKDLEFDKGGNVYDRYYGDPTNLPNPCLGALTKAPYYALKLNPGDIGTKGGLMADEYARVLSTEGTPIPGLYVIGNNAGALMGPSYPGPGSTLGPAMVMGCVAADHIAGRDTVE
ncbi:FAD-dependent oxidoreductase [Sphingomonas sp. KC8]|uniref:FAD-dependent oxidoreductase n=1 Tax=Sphingomonas sp. KC8 TaxID=1030157 RepID=UPI000248BE6C|nr:FAD-dependent oxidoreductase [Sphingomonas sp. KC8]ARS26691.1 3-ketosteroid-delta1-dehydrogenase [Sphingomonas sp. KC8]